MKVRVLPDESNQSKVAHHGDEVDDEEHQEEWHLQLWMLRESCEDKLSHQSLVSFYHIRPGESLRWKGENKQVEL